MQIWCKYHILAGFPVAFTVSSEATVYNSSDCVHSKIKKTLIVMCPKHIVDLNVLICVYQCCGNYSSQVINYDYNYLAISRTHYHYHYSAASSNQLPLQLL